MSKEGDMWHWRVRDGSDRPTPEMSTLTPGDQLTVFRLVVLPVIVHILFSFSFFFFKNAISGSARYAYEIIRSETRATLLPSGHHEDSLS